MFLTSLFVLISLLGWIQFFFLRSANDRWKLSDSLLKLQHKYFVVYFPAVFADWLQGPYLYKLYNSYGFRDDEIFLLYIVGFASSLSFGTCISCLSDYVGRKRMCIVFHVVYAIACLTKTSSDFEVLFIGRILSGIGSSILFSVFEAWYIHQHVEKQLLPVSWISNTLSKTTFYNGLLAILAGLVSHIFADILEMGPVFPFLLAVPCLITSALLTIFLWEETCSLQNCHDSGTCKFNPSFLSSSVIFLCIIQSVFESVMYVFVILWTPILSPVKPPLGVVFSCFMLCIMIGSSFYSWFVSKKYDSTSVLTLSMFLGAVAFGICSVSLSKYSDVLFPYDCFVCFLLYEVAVGLYFPAIGFIRSCIIPEHNRAGLSSWFRVPMNLVTCFSLFYFRGNQHRTSNIILDSVSSLKLTSNQHIFALCAFALLCSCGFSRKLKINVNHLHCGI